MKKVLQNNETPATHFIEVCSSILCDNFNTEIPIPISIIDKILLTTKESGIFTTIAIFKIHEKSIEQQIIDRIAKKTVEDIDSGKGL